MKKHSFLPLLILMTTQLFGQELPVLKLLPPQLNTGKTVMSALAERHSARIFSARELSLQDFSNILWAANGINRPGEMKHTAPTARNWQDVDVYAVTKDGAYRYNPHDSTLAQITAGDFRKQAGMQDFVYTAPLNLIYVSDLSLMDADEQTKLTYAAADAAFIAENVYLCCAAFDLGCVVRASIVKDELAKTLKLKSSQKIMLAQTIGYLP